MNTNRLFTILRYISFLFIIFGISLVKEGNIDIYSVILVLLFIINSQTRFFIFRSKKLLVFISIIVECIMGFFLYKNYEGIIFFYFFIAISDSIFLLDGKKSYLSIAICIIMELYTGKELNLVDIISEISSNMVLAIICLYISFESNRRLTAQKLYNKLRISEENLKKANRDLERYTESIEELTLLRERNRISREIHDSVGHSLSTIIIQLGAIEKISKKDGNVASDMAKNLAEFAKNGLSEIRTAIRELKPMEYEKYESIIAIEDLAKNFTKLTGVDVRLGFTKEKWALNADQSFVIYRVVQEFLSNSLRHGKAERVNIFMNYDNNDLIITLQDNGIGTDNIKKGIGLRSIYERVNEVGGYIDYNSKSGQGFLMKVVLNLNNQLSKGII
ncbi:sensor histidine kinase [Gottschalkia acidurici]|nr:sensor histidine kinase [Gottschalkia acidurici]